MDRGPGDRAEEARMGRAWGDRTDRAEEDRAWAEVPGDRLRRPEEAAAGAA